MIRRVIGALALICATAGPTAAAQLTSSNAILLRYDERLIALGFPSPLLRATIHGQSAWFIVDTGASVHTLASWLVNAARLSPRAVEATVTGSTGGERPVRAVFNQTIQLQGGLGLDLREAIVVDLPPIFAKNRIGGLLSPQLLAARHEASVLDLRVPNLRFEAFASAVAKLPRQPTITSADSRVCRNADSRFNNRLYAAPVTAAGTAGVMLIDTGATSTLATPGSAIARDLNSRASETTRVQAVGGDSQMLRRAPGVRVRYGGTEATVDVTIGGAKPSCGPDGRIAMDALRRCVLLLAESRFAWSCDAD